MSLSSLLKHRGIVGLGALITLSITFYVYVIDASSRALIDLDVYLQAARALAHGEEMYQRAFTTTDRWGRPIQLFYLYPPLLAHVLSLFSGLSVPLIKFGWCLLNFVLMLVTSVTLARTVQGSWWGTHSFATRSLVIGFFVVCFEPLYVGNGDGQVTAMVLALLTLSAYGAARGNDLFGGTMLAIAIQIKMSPAILLVAPLTFKRWRFLGACAATSLLLVLFTLVFGGGFQPFIDFAHSVTQTVDDAVFQEHVFNFNLNRAVLDPLGMADLPLARLLVKAALLAFAVAGTLAIRAQGGNSMVRAYGFLMTCMIVSSPIIWFHHLAWMLVPLTILSMKPAATSDDRLKHLTITLGLYFALSQSYLLSIWVRKIAPPLVPIATLVPLALLLGTAVALLRQRRP
jgi:hypothetical protein